MDWKSLWRHWFGPKDYIKRRCPIDGLLMEMDSAGVFHCPQGHILDPNKRGQADPLIEASKGHQSGEI